MNNILDIEVNGDGKEYQLYINLPDEVAAKKILGMELIGLAKAMMLVAFALLNLEVQIDIE